VSLSHPIRIVAPVSVRAVIDDLLGSLLPSRCPGCGAAGAPVCPACATGLRAARPAPPPAPVAWWTSLYAYEGVAREMVARAKYRGERRALIAVARDLAAAIERAPHPANVITWVPASADRRRARGVDHAEVLARVLARESRRRVAPLLHRYPGPAQTGRDARARRRGPSLRAFGVPAGATVLVVDDVSTTGGTLAAAARALRSAGAAAVYAATIARTPAPGSRSTGPAYTAPKSMS